MICLHYDWDDYFERCWDCGVSLDALGVTIDEDGNYIITREIEL